MSQDSMDKLIHEAAVAQELFGDDELERAAAENKPNAPAPAETMEIQYVRLDELVQHMVWEDNPKLHNEALIAGAIGEYGFIDSVGVDLKLRKVVYGHGRLNDLASKMNRAEPPPRYIQRAEDGMWLVPVTPLHFDDVTQLYRAALMHNRAGVLNFDARDYNASKLDRALKAASAPQLPLPGFGNEELNIDTWQSPIYTQTPIDLPPLPAFDEQLAKTSAGVAPGQLTQTEYTIVISLTDRKLFYELVALLSLGTRTELSEHIKSVFLDGSKMVSGYRKAFKALADIKRARNMQERKRRATHKKSTKGETI